jgi:uncharacterized protein (TIGR02270 family)
MAAPKMRVLVDILEEHLEELPFLWGQRQSALRSPRYTLRELGELEERIEAHVQGLLVGGEQIVAMLQPGLTGEEPGPAFIAAYILSRLAEPDVRSQVWDAFLKAKGGQLAGIRQALCHLPVDPVLPKLRQIVSGATPVSAELRAAAAEVLGFHSRLDIKAQETDRLLNDEEPTVRETGWRAISYGIPPAAETYKAGLRDKSPAVRNAALLAAAWGRQPWLLAHCRQAAVKPTADDLDTVCLLGVLGKPAELPGIVSLAKATELGPGRYRALGAFGHPGVVDELLSGMENRDPLTAVAAAAAFTKITGVKVDSDRRATVPPADGHEPDDFEKEFLDEVRLPDPALARAQWQKVKAQFSKGTRWCGALDLSQAPAKEILSQLDLESRWEACLRGKFDGTWSGSPAALAAFPQNRG